MFFQFHHFKHNEYHPSRLLRSFQIFLLTLIVMGIGLLITQKMWVPALVQYMLRNEVHSVTPPDPIFKHAENTQSFSTSTEAVIPKSVEASTVAQSPTRENSEPIIKTALLANGCFWCVEHDLEKVAGVTNIVSGYAGGSTENPTYKNYAEGGHREVVLVTYDALKVTFANLVEHIIKHGDPTDTGGSFYDRGQEYVPAIYYETDAEKAEAYRVIHAIDALHVFEKPLPLVVLLRAKFWPAEDYHQNYGEENPIRYTYYRNASGRDAFIEKHWGDRANIFEVSNMQIEQKVVPKEDTWNSYIKPSRGVLEQTLTALQYKVTQEEGTEPSHNNLYDKNYDEGIYVDIVSGEPLYFSKDKYDSGTGWPSFVKPISDDVVVLKEDNGLFTKRTEVRSRYADSHLGHVFDDGPADRGGKRYCMNSASLRFIPKSDMEKEGYGYLIDHV